MICINCNEEYDNEMFDCCPYCLATADDSEVVEVKVDMKTTTVCCADSELKDDNISEINVVSDFKNVEECEIEFPKEDITVNLTTAAYSDETKILEAAELKARCVLYLEKKYIQTIGQLREHLQHNNLEDMPIGKKDKNKLLALLNPSAVYYNTVFEFINEELLDIDIWMLSTFGITNKVIGCLERNGIVTIGDLQRKPIDFFLNIIKASSTDKLLKLEPLLEKDLRSVLETLLDDLSNKDGFDFAVMRAEGYTLQEVGEVSGLTRERIRQVVAKFNKDLDILMKSITNKFIREKGYVTLQDILDIYDNDDYDKILVNWCKCSDDLEYLDFADVFVKTGQDGHFHESQILELAKEFVGEGLDLYNNIEALDTILSSKGYSYIDASAIVNLLKKNRGRVYGSYVTPGRVSYAELCVKIIAKKFPQGIRIHDKHDLDLLREYAKAEYGEIGIPVEDRAFGARLFSFLVLSGRGVATAPENVQVEMSLLEEIKNYIDTSCTGDIYYAYLFEEYEGMIRTLSNIDNHHFLHGVLMLYYPNEYSYARDYLKKNNEGCVSERLSDVISKFILQNNKPVHKNEIKRRFTGRSDITLILAINKSEDLFMWEYNYYYSTELVDYNDDDLKWLGCLIDNLLEDYAGYCSERLLYEKVKEQNAIFLEKCGMKSEENLYQFCSKMFGTKYKFRRPHICKIDLMEELSVKNVALYLLGNPDNLSYNAYMDITYKLRWSLVTSGIVFNEIEQDYIRVSKDWYVKKEKFTITSEHLSAIESIIDSKMKNGFMTLYSFDEWEKLPELEYEWNEFLLDVVLKKYSSKLKVIDAAAKDRRYIKGVVVANNSQMREYADVVLHILNSLGKKEISQKDLLTLLLVNGFYLKMLPQEFYISEKLEFRNEKFYVVE